jgi:hypothetical protein
VKAATENWGLAYPELKTKGFVGFGGLHSYKAAEKAATAYGAGSVPKEMKDDRWFGWPTKVYCFPDAIDNYERILRILGDEDNRNQMQV